MSGASSNNLIEINAACEGEVLVQIQSDIYAVVLYVTYIVRFVEYWANVQYLKLHIGQSAHEASRLVVGEGAPRQHADRDARRLPLVEATRLCEIRELSRAVHYEPAA